MSAPRTCDCMSCTKCYHREYARKKYAAKTAGTWKPKGDIAAVIAHIDELRANGVGCNTITDQAGIARSTFTRIVGGQNKWISAEVASRIFAVTVDDARRIDITGSARRIQALNALGWSTYELATRLDTHQAHVVDIMRRNHSTVTRKTHDGIVDLYNQLSMKLGPSNISRIRARTAGYLPPLCWDEDAIDDPDAKPGGVHVDDTRQKDELDPIVVDRFLTGDISPGLWATLAEKREIVRRWSETGRSMNDLERITGWQPSRYRQGAA